MKLLDPRVSPHKGSVLLVVLALLAVMCLLIAVNTQTLYTLKRELQLIDKQQRQYWTNAVSVRPGMR